jgi:threonine dehydrogenase-like Zn-dependent dehydrogenase
MIANICQEIYPQNKIIISGTSDFKLSYAGNAEKININNHKINFDDIDSAIVCAGTAEALDAAIEVCRSRGTICMFSAIHVKVPVDMFRVHVKELNICGSCNDMDYLDDAMALLAKSKIADVITHELPFDEYKRAFELAGDKSGEVLKVTMIF